LLVIKRINDNVDEFPQEMEAWEACILQAGGDASQCEDIAMNILPIYRLWVGELFMSLTGIETFIVEGSQKCSSLGFVLTIGDSGLDGWSCSGVVTVLSHNVSEGEYGHKLEIDGRWGCIDYHPYLEDYIVRTFQFRGFGTSTRMKISLNFPTPQQQPIPRNHPPRYLIVS
jgi:hypothetical protein